MSTASLSAADRAAWRGLADTAAEPNPFFTPEFVMAGVEARGEHAELLVVRDPARWLACAPMRRAPGWRRLRLPCLVPWMLDEYTFLTTPLVAMDALEPACAALADAIVAEREAAAVVFDPIGCTGPIHARLVAELRARGVAPIVFAEFERAALRRRPENTYLAETFGRSRRKSSRRARRRLASALGSEPVVIDRSAEPTAWERFIELERSGWKGAAGTAIGSRGEDAAFFRRMCAAFAERGELQVLTFEVPGRVAAMQCNLIARGTLFAFKVAYDERLARFSPGTLLEIDAIDVFHGRSDLTLMDSCADPRNAGMNALWPDRVRMQTLIVPTGSWRRMLVRPPLLAGRWLNRLRRRVGRAGAVPAGSGEPDSRGTA